MLTREMADDIVRETMRRLDRNINIMDEEGTIIASGNRRRVGERHAAALEAIRSGRTVAIAASNAPDGRGAQPGVNMPIVFQNRTVGAIGITGDPEEVSEFAELVRMTTELMLQQAYFASLQESRNRMKASVAEELGRPGGPDASKLFGLLAMLRLNPKPPIRICLARWNATDVEGLREAPPLQQALESVWGERQATVAPVDPRACCVLAFGMNDAAWAAAIDKTKMTIERERGAARIGVSGVAFAPEELGALYREASDALAAATGERPIVAYAEVEAETIVRRSDDAAKRRFAERTVAALPDSLKETLEAFFRCDRNMQATADALYVHKNTVGYRLKKIKEATGLDPLVFGDAVALQIGLWIGRTE